MEKLETLSPREFPIDDRNAEGQAWSVLVIGYGNTLRGDDGVGYRIAETVAAWGLAGVRSLPCHQLTPELAIDIAQSQRVLFVDALVVSPMSTPIPCLEQLLIDVQVQTSGHSSNPRSLLAIAQALYQKTPQASWLLVPVLNVEFGEILSDFAEQSMAAALTTIRCLITAEKDGWGHGAQTADP